MFRFDPFRFIPLLNPFWNHWLSLQCDWLSAVRFIHESHYICIFCSKSHLFPSQWEWDSKTKYQSDFKAKKKLSFGKFGHEIVRFQNGSNKVASELRVVQFWSEIILVNSNRTRAAPSFDFEITHMISDQIALHSVQLPLLILHVPPIYICQKCFYCVISVLMLDVKKDRLMAKAKRL